MSVEFTDETGTKRKLTRDELITFFNVLAGAGNETTNRLIGWTGKTLAEHPDQRRELVRNPSLLPDALEEVLRLEPPAPHVGRYVAKDAEFHGQAVPAGSAILLLVGAANHDERAFPDPDRFDIRRDRRTAHIAFGYGIHSCIGNVLARLEGRVVFEELLKRIPEWEVDMENASLLSTSTVRGWDKLPACVSAAGAQKIKNKAAMQAEAANVRPGAPPASIDGEWTLTVNGPTGAKDTKLSLRTVDGTLSGTQSGDGTSSAIEDITYDRGSGNIAWTNKIDKPMKMTVKFSGQVESGRMSGKVKAGFMGSYPFTAVKA